MMRFSALLTAKITKARIARVFQPARGERFLTFVDPADVLHPGSAHPVSHDRIRSILASDAPLIWMGGSEPLDHPGIAHLVRALAPSGHAIFLETNGTLLRRRIHEFQPLPQLFLAVHLDPQAKSANSLALEGLRAARLSGFFTVVHSLVRETIDLAELGQLRTLLLQMDLDGWLITAASTNPSLAARSAQARKLIPSAAWRWFSKRFERELLAQELGRKAQSLPHTEKSQAAACEKDAKVA